MNTFVMNVSINLRRCNHFLRLRWIAAQSAKVWFASFTTMLALFLKAADFIKLTQELHQLLLPHLPKLKVKTQQPLNLRINCDVVGDHF